MEKKLIGDDMIWELKELIRNETMQLIRNETMKLIQNEMEKSLSKMLLNLKIKTFCKSVMNCNGKLSY